MKYFTVLISLFFVNLASATTKVEETSLRIGNVNQAISITSHIGDLRTYPSPVWQVEVKAEVNQQLTVLRSAEVDSNDEAEQLQARLQEIVLSHFNFLPVKLTTTETVKIIHCVAIATTTIEAEVLEHDPSQTPIILTGKSSKSHYDYDRCDF